MEELDNWPMCKVKGCPYNCCKALDSVYCYPHSVGLTQEIIHELNKEKELEEVK